MGLIGLAVLLLAMIWMVIRAANFDSLIPPLIGVLLSLVLVAGGLACSPVSGEAAGSTVAARLSGVLGLDLGEVRKFADEGLGNPQDIPGLFMDEGGKPSESKDEPNPESKEEPEPAEAGSRDQAESGTAQSLSAPAVSAAVQDRVPYEAILNGWRVRMTLPSEWSDLSDIYTYEANSRTYLCFEYKTSAGHVFSLTTVEGPIDLEDTDSGYYNPGAHAAMEVDPAGHL